jgi:hypothetical protein
MPPLSRQKWWNRVSARKGAANKQYRFRKFFLEALEDRTLLSPQVFTVNITTDAGIGTGNTGDIRYCINQANLSGNAGSTITFDKALGSTIFLSGNELAIAQNMTIEGPVGGGLSITGQGESRIFDVTSSTAKVTISNLTITNGNANPTFQFAPGNQGGDIFNGGNLTLSNDIVSNGVSQGVIGGPPGRGGGIFNARNATLTLDNTTVTGNSALGNNGMGAGGGIYNDTNATLLVTNGTIISNNQAVGSSGRIGFSVLPPAPPSAARGIPGGNGGNGTAAGGMAAGGGIYNNGSLTVSRIAGPPIIFSGNVAQGGSGGSGGFGGPGGPGSKATGGTGGRGGNGLPGGDALGGGIYNAVGSLSVDGAQFTNNQALGGAGGSGGKGGLAGAGKPGGVGGKGGNGADGGQAWGGAIYNTGGDLNIGSAVGSLFTSNLVQSGQGGNGGSGGTGGTGNSAPGGAGGAGGIAGGGTFAYGGAISVVTGGLSVSTTGFGGPTAGAGNQVIGSAGGTGGRGGTGGKGASGFPGGRGGFGADGGNGGFVKGGAISTLNDATNVVLNQDDFEGNSIVSGAGGAGGAGGTGGQGGKGSFGGQGGLGGTGHESGEAWGGGLSYVAPDINDLLTHSLSITATPFINQKATAAAGGNGGAAGQGGPGGKSTAPGFSGTTGTGGLGQDARGGGLFVYSGAVTVPVSITSSPFNNDRATGNGGGSGFPGNNGSAAYGGAIDLWATTLAPGSATLNGLSLTNNIAAAGAGGAGGGFGGLVKGGALAADNYSVTLNSSSVTGNQASSGGGGGGDSGTADGGGIAVTGETTTGVTLTLTSSAVSGNTLSQGNASFGGGNAGTALGPIWDGARGGGISLTGVSAQISNSTIDSNTAAAGAGGAGFSGGGTGQAGGGGGTALGGGVFFYNPLSASLTLNISNGSISNNQLAGGNGGQGGNAGGGGSVHIGGGVGGDGGRALGGGIFTLTGSAGVTTSTLSNLLLANEVVTAGSGANGGQGEDGNGGNGALAAGGGLYATGFNTSTPSTTTLSNTTLMANQVIAGHGGTAGSGTTPNGGQGGNGGDGGNADGGGVFGGDNIQLSVYNTTIGGISSNPSQPNGPSNILIAGDGGNGGNAGTPARAPTNNGGNGGNGGNALGGGVFIDNSTTNFINNTIVNNQATTFGLGGAGGSGAGTGGLAGSVGAVGAGIGGGYFNAGASNTNQVGNTILDLNAAGTDPDVSGTFSSLGRNLLGSVGSSTGFSSTAGGTDRIGITALQLNLGPLQNNGGFAPTDSLLKGSAAIDGGNNSLLSFTPSTDERGTGFSRVFNNVVDIGAVEFQPPTITGLSQTSILRGSNAFTLTITGTDFLPGAVVSFGGTILTPTSISGSQIVVVVPASSMMHHGTFPITVADPDGSGIVGQVVSSTPTNFTITLPSTLPLNGVANQSNNEGDVVSLQVTSPDPDASNFSATGLPPGLSINPATGLISGTLDPRAAGAYAITVSATDSNTSGSITFNWTVADTTPPALPTIGPRSNNVGDQASLGLIIVDADPGSVTVTGLPPGLSFNAATNVISGTLAANSAGNYTVTISASDGGLSSNTTFNWTVIQPGAHNPGQNAGSINIGGFAFSLPAPGQSAGLFGLALEEFELTLNSDLAFIFSLVGLANKQFQDPIPALLSAINNDPLVGTPLGSFALMLGFSAALQVL